ncbi:MAG: PHP domain-containing protein [Planctomycetota bacterium]
MRPAKGGLNAWNLLPLTYWLRRYTASGAGSFLFRILFIDGFVLSAAVLLLFHSGWGVLKTALTYYALARFAFLSLYELGYFVNDFWSEKREQVRSGTQPQATPGSAWLWPSVLTRIATAGVLFYGLHRLFGSPVATAWGLIVGLTLLNFMLHNAIFFPWRAITFLFLQVGTFGVLVPIFRYLGQPAAILPYALICTGPILGLTLFYVAGRVKGKLFFMDLDFGPFYRGCVNYALRICVLWLLAMAVVAPFYPPLVWWWPLTLAAALLALDAVLVAARFMKSMRGAARQHAALYHLHTDVSHDATITLDEIAALVAQTRYRDVYLTDHAEDFNQEKFDALTEQCKRLTGDIRFHPGLEYSVHGQHILCLDLTHFIDFNIDSIPLLEQLKGATSRLIWAHPSFGYRFLLSKSKYRGNLIRLMRNVDMLEVINYKMKRNPSHRRRNLLVAFFAVLMRNVPLTVGVDAHTKAQLEGYIQFRGAELLKNAGGRTSAA